MKLKNQTIQVNAFVDGELTLSEQLEMEERLRADADLQRQVDEARQLREVIQKGSDYHAAPAQLHARLAALLSEPKAAPRPVAAAWPSWFSWRPLAASFSLVLVVGVALNLLWLQSSKEDRLSDNVVASHVRSTVGEHLVDVVSSDRHTVKPFLSSKLGFSPPVDALQVAGSVFLGGRVDYLDGRPVAALVYKQGRHVVNSFVWPSRASTQTPSFSTERGFQMAHWTENGMTHWVISDVNAQEFQTVVKAVRQLDVAR